MGARTQCPSPIRAPLEHDPHPYPARISIDVDTGRALEALRLGYGDIYDDFTVDPDGTWQARRRDGKPGVSGSGPDGLHAAILADAWPRT